MTTLASQGTQYLALFLFARGVGDANRNVQIGVWFVIVLTASARPACRARARLFLVLGLVLGVLLFGVGLLSDIRSKGGAEGRHRLVLRHVQPLPQHPSGDLAARHRRARAGQGDHPSDADPGAARGRVSQGPAPRRSAGEGFQIYETTDKADVNVDYLPTGNMFLPPETRQALIELAVAEAGLGDKVELAFYREIYDTKGFLVLSSPRSSGDIPV